MPIPKILLLIMTLYAFSSCSKSAAGSDAEPLLPDPTTSLREQYSMPTSKWPSAEWYEGIRAQELAPLSQGPINTQQQQKVIALGKVLFFDPRVGRGEKTCATCHHPDIYWVDRRQTAAGIATHHRNTPSMENVWYVKGQLFHDGRAKTYAEQIAEAIESPIEMGGNTYTLPVKLAAIKGYHHLFDEAYGDANITRTRILDALAIYSQSIVSGETHFDRFIQGDYTALSDQQIEGLHLFRTKGKCINCHHGPYLTDLQYHNLGYAVD